jgi:alpha-galactosidase/6-phospho-beta-glucosidase family protein
VPVFADLARRIERVAPQAWLINVSNPLTPLTRHIGACTALRTVGVGPEKVCAKPRKRLRS